MNRKSSTRNPHFPSTPSTHAALLARFRQQMADHARGERLQKLRTERRLTQEEAAHEIGVSAKTLRTWEKGGPIKWENAKSAGSFYEVDPESLVSREPGDLMGEMRDATNQSQLDRIEDALAELQKSQAALAASVAELVADRALEQQQSQRRRR